MARYVMANRRAGKFTTRSKLASRAALETVLASRAMSRTALVARTQPRRETDRSTAIFDADPRDAARMARTLPRDVILEPEILHHHSLVRPRDFLAHATADSLPPLDAGKQRTMSVRVLGGDEKLKGALVTLFLRGGGMSSELTGTTNGLGRVTFTFDKSFEVSALLAEPAGGYWNRVVRGPDATVTVACPALPKADNRLGWWHQEVGLTTWSKSRGAGIRVGVIDTGVGPNGELKHVTDVGSFVEAEMDPDGGADVELHGTHVCGTIAARPTAKSRFGGVAPGVRLFSARVFPPDEGANQLDIANAIDALSKEHQADLINMSLGAELESQIEYDAIQDAWERGTVCVCAAGNEAGPVSYPAAFEQTVAVSALGKLGWGDPESLSGQRLSDYDEDYGNDNLYLANFSNYGDEITCTAPGVGIIATVPERFGLKKPQVAMDGTSMASPVACGVLAALLSKSGLYRNLERNSARSAAAINILKTAAQTIGLPAYSEGTGMPVL